MTDKIEITEEQYYQLVRRDCQNKTWAEAKAFISKPKRREFWIVEVPKLNGPNITVAYHSRQEVEEALKIGCIGSTRCFEVEEVLPGDLPRMTKAEAREWILKGLYGIGITFDDNDKILKKYFGLSEDG